jgi:hypothetical protein
MDKASAADARPYLLDVYAPITSSSDPTSWESYKEDADIPIQKNSTRKREPHQSSSHSSGATDAPFRSNLNCGVCGLSCSVSLKLRIVRHRTYCSRFAGA